MSVGRICAREVSLAEEGESVVTAARRMAEHRVGSLVVADAGRRPRGIVTDRDLVRRVLAPGRDPARTRVGEVMTPRPQTAGEDTPIEAALERMRVHRVRRLPVVDAEGRLVGLLALDDALELLGEEMRSIGGLIAGAGAGRPPRAPEERATRATVAAGRADAEHAFVAAMRARLRDRRIAILRLVADTEAELEVFLGQRESEIEERAEEHRTARLLGRLDDRGREAIREIDAALARIEEGRYGVCLECGRKISFARLQALPAARLCGDCARETDVVEESPGEELPPEHRPRLPADLALLSDREIEETVREALEEDDRVETSELRVLCRHGVVSVHGALPSEPEHQILRGIVLDVLGIEDLIDHVQIDERLFERHPPSRRPRTLPRDVEDMVSDASESEGDREGLEEEPMPTGRPVPEGD